MEHLHKLKLLHDLLERLLRDIGVEVPDTDSKKRKYLSVTKRVYAALLEAYKLGEEDLKRSIEQDKKIFTKRKTNNSLGIKEVRATIQAITSELQYNYEANACGITIITPENYREHLLRVLNVLEAVAEKGSGYVEVK